MGKIQTKLLLKQARHNQSEGLIRVSFSFVGRNYVREHRLNGQEIAAAKEMLAEHGGKAFDSATVKSPIFIGRSFGEYVINEALKEYAREHFIQPREVKAPKNILEVEDIAETEVTAKEVMDALAKKRGIVLGSEQVKAVDDTAGLEGEGA